LDCTQYFCISALTILNQVPDSTLLWTPNSTKLAIEAWVQHWLSCTYFSERQLAISYFGMTAVGFLQIVEPSIWFSKLVHQYASFVVHPRSWALVEDHTSSEADSEASNLGWQPMTVDFAGFSQGMASGMAQVHQEVSCLEDKVILGCLGFFRSYFGYFCG
jgi:hypothetical protein